MNPRETQNLLATIRNERRGGTPHESWVKENRKLLLRQVERQTESPASESLGERVSHFFDVFTPMESLMVTARALGVFMLMVGTVLAGGLTSAQVYADAKPGDFFYGAKVAVERTQLVFAPNEKYKTRLHTEFADRRMDEIARLADAGGDAQAYIADALVAFEREVLALESGLEELREANSIDLADSAKLMERKMAVYQNVLRKASVTLSSDLYVAISATRGLIDDASITAMAILVEKHLEGDNRAPRSIVINNFEERIRLAESDLDGTAKTGEEENTRAIAAIAEVKNLIQKEEYQAALVKIAEVAELTVPAEEEEELCVDEDDTECEEENANDNEDSTESSDEESVDAVGSNE